jgi:polyphosphate kinase
VSDEADDLLEAVQVELRRRRFGDVVRLEVSESMSSAMLERLKTGLGVTDAEVYRINELLDLADASQVAELDRPDLKDEPWVPVTQGRVGAASERDLFAEISRSDVFVHHPYESFGTSFEAFVKAASRDRDVIGLKTTVYEDVGLFTADEEIGADVADLFNYLTGFAQPRRFRKLLAAPFALRARLVEEIRAVAAAGGKGRIRIKVNQLTDATIVDEL